LFPLIYTKVHEPGPHYFNLLCSPIFIPIATYQDGTTWLVNWLCLQFPIVAPHFPALAQITLSSVRLSLSLSEVDCSCVLLNENLFQPFNCILCFQKLLDFIENNFHASYFVGYSIILLLVFYKLL
jgi:hypothetical protein